MILLPHRGLAADYSFRVLFNTRKSTFYSHPAGGKPRSGIRILLSFGGSFCFFASGWRLACSNGLFPRVLLHEMDVLEERKSTAGELT